MLSSLVQWAAVALFLCPCDTGAFLTLPGACSPQLKTRSSGHRHDGHGRCHRRDSLRLEAGVRDGGGGGGCGGGSGDAGDGGNKPPRSVLQRPWDVEVDFHGERHIITVQPGDSILEAAEMSGMNISYECRRGSCISCAARVQDGSSGHFDNNADRRPDDGAPDGFVLTCSTYPTGPGVKLELSANVDMWMAFCTRFDNIDTQALFRQASAGLMRKYRVEHPEEFREEVERQFQAPEA